MSPQNAKLFVRRIRRTDDQLMENNTAYYLDAMDGHKLPHLRKEGRAIILARKVYELFITRATETGRTHPIPSTEIEEILEGASRGTVGTIRKILQSRPLRRENKWHWSFPRRSPDKAKQKMLDKLIEEANPYKEELLRRNRPVVKELEEIMRLQNFQATNKLVLELMAEAGYTRRTVITAKSTLGVATIKREGTTMWLWPAPEVVDWLAFKLSHGSVVRNQLEFEAKTEHGWCFDLMVLAREVRGGITWSTRNGAVVWTDVNQTPPPPVLDTTVEIDNNIYTDEWDRTVVVDFSEDYTDHELAPDEAIADASAPEPRQVTVPGTSVKLEIFE